MCQPGPLPHLGLQATQQLPQCWVRTGTTPHQDSLHPGSHQSRQDEPSGPGSQEAEREFQPPTALEVGGRQEHFHRPLSAPSGFEPGLERGIFWQWMGRVAGGGGDAALPRVEEAGKLFICFLCPTQLATPLLETQQSLEGASQTSRRKRQPAPRLCPSPDTLTHCGPWSSGPASRAS